MIINFTKHKIALLIVVALGFFVLGYMTGVYTTVKAVAKMASGFIDPRLVEQAYWQFRNNVAACYPPLI